MQALEARDQLDRAVEVLPGTQAMAEREKRGEPLTRAEIGVLLAYAKIVLSDDVVASELPDDPHFETGLMDYFPDRMAKKYATEIREHRLRRDIIATALCNDAINRGGPSFVSRMQDLTGRSPAEVVAAFAVVRDGFELPALYAEIDALDTTIDGDAQLELYQAVGRLIHAATGWYLKNDETAGSLGERIVRLRDARKTLEGKIGPMLTDFTRERIEERTHALFKAGAPERLAERIAFLNIVELIPDIVRVAGEAKADLVAAARAFFAVSDAFRVGRISDAARTIMPADYYDGLALSRAMETINAARRGMAVNALGGHGKDDDPVGAWLEAGGHRFTRARDRLQTLTEGGDLTVSRLSVAAGLMSDLG